MFKYVMKLQMHEAKNSSFVFDYVTTHSLLINFLCSHQTMSSDVMLRSLIQIPHHNQFATYYYYYYYYSIIFHVHLIILVNVSVEDLLSNDFFF